MTCDVTAKEIKWYLSRLHSTDDSIAAHERMKTLYRVEIETEKQEKKDLVNWLKSNIGQPYLECYRPAGGNDGLRNWVLSKKSVRVEQWPFNSSTPTPLPRYRSWHVALFTNEQDALMFALNFAS